MSIFPVPPVGVVVLAAGLSSRMGCPKLLLPFRGRPLIAHALALALRCGPPGPVIAVLGPHAPAALYETVREDSRILTVCAEDAAMGQTASLRAGIGCALEEEARKGERLAGICVLLGDQPLVADRTVYHLIAALHETPDAFIVPVFDGCRGNPVVIPRVFFMRAMALRGDTGARPLLAASDTRVRRVFVDDPGVLRDVDTPEAYAALQQEYREGIPA